MKAFRSILYATGLPVLLIALWWVGAVAGSSFFVPDPVTVAEAFTATWLGERFLADVLPSVARLAAGVAAATLVGVALGIAIGSLRWLRALTEPILEFFRAIPPPVLVPVLMLFLGVGNSMKIVVIAAGCIWPVLLNTVAGVRAVDPVLSDASNSYGVRGAYRFRYLVLPSASPQIAAGIRQSLAIGLILMVVSEMFASSAGLGFTIVHFQRTFAIPQMWSGIVLLGLIGIALAMLFRWTERRVLRWYHGLKEVDGSA